MRFVVLPSRLVTVLSAAAEPSLMNWEAEA